MAPLKALNIITAVYFLCSAGISTWIGFELYYTINPTNKVINYDKDGKVDPKPVPNIESPPKGIKSDEPQPFKSVPIDIKTKPTEKKEDKIEGPVEEKVKTIIPDPPFKEHKTVDLEPPAIIKDESHQHPTEVIKKVQPLGDDDLEEPDASIDLHTPVKKVEKKKVVQEPISDPERLPPKPQLEDAKKHTPEEPTVGVFTDLYYGLSNGKQGKPVVMEEKLLKDAPPKLDPEKAKLKVEEPTVGIFTDLYYGLSNKKPDAVSLPIKKVVKEVKKMEDEGPTVGIFTELYYHGLTKTPPKTEKLEKIKDPIPPGKGLKTEEPTVGVFTDLYYGLSNKIPKPEKAKKTLKPKIPGDIKHPSVDLERPEVGHVEDGHAPDEASKHLRDSREKIVGVDGHSGLEDSADEFFT